MSSNKIVTVVNEIGDDYTLTSKRYIWSSPGKTYSKNTVIVEQDPLALLDYNCYGICSDYVGRMR